MKKLFLFVLFVSGIFCFVSMSFAAQVGTGKIVNIQTRPWGLHIQTDFGFDGAEGIECPVSVGATYMYDFLYSSDKNSPDASFEKTALLTAYTTGRDVYFHIYECNSNGSRPVIGYIVLK